MITIEIGKNEKHQRLDKFLRKYLDATPLSAIYKIIRKDVKVNGKRKKEDYLLEEGDVLALYLKDGELERLRKPKKRVRVKKQFKVEYEDENLLIVSKPSGLLTHGNKQEHRNHLANQVVDFLIASGKYNPREERTFTPAPVNRLDRNTSGLVIFAKNYQALQDFNRFIRERGMIHKHYVTLTAGMMRRSLQLVGHMEKDEQKNRVRLSEQGKEMRTAAKPLCSTDELGGVTLAEVEIETGRTHQIRVQLSDAGYPLLGDPKYGNPQMNREALRRWGISTQCLHAFRLEFEGLPAPYEALNGMQVSSPLPREMAEVCRDLFRLEKNDLWNS